MPTLKTILLVMVCAALGVLVWLDNRPDTSTADIHPAAKREAAAQPAEPPVEQVATEDTASLPADQQPAVDASATEGQSPAPEGDAQAAAAPETAQSPAGEESQPELPSASKYATDPSSINPLAAISAESLNETVDRPLVSPTRKRPPVQQAANAPAAPSERDDAYELLGVALSDDRAIAVMRKKKDGTNIRVEEGDTLGAWQVSKVEPRSVHLERADGEQEVVRLYRR